MARKQIKSNPQLSPDKKVIREHLGDYYWSTFFISKSGIISNDNFEYNEDLAKSGNTLYQDFYEYYKTTIMYTTRSYTDDDIIGFELKRDSNYESSDDYDLYLIRLETDDEVNSRIASEEKRIAAYRRTEAARKKKEAEKAAEKEALKDERDYKKYLELKERYKDIK